MTEPLISQTHSFLKCVILNPKFVVFAFYFSMSILNCMRFHLELLEIPEPQNSR